MKILIAYDGSSAADAAVGEVLKRPWPEGTEILLITVVERPISMPSPNGIEVYAPLIERFRASLREEAHQKLRAVLLRFEERLELQVSYELREGSPKQGLLDSIHASNPDLVVAGSHGAGAVATLLLGSTCQALVAHAPCSVEVVKTPAAQ